MLFEIFCITEDKVIKSIHHVHYLILQLIHVFRHRVHSRTLIYVVISRIKRMILIGQDQRGKLHRQTQDLTTITQRSLIKVKQ